jgi:regulator of sirC expression with transglutaminase-like and TPR domain
MSVSAPLLDPKLSAMISLLDDEDEAIFKSVSKELFGVFKSDRPEAAEVMRLIVEKKNGASDFVSARIEDFIDEIQFQKLSPQFLRGLMDGATLESFVFMIMHIGYPDADAAIYKRELARLESALRVAYFTSSMTEVDKVFMMSVALFEREGYRGNAAGYYEPDNSYINRVVERKLGIPISLGAIYLMLAERLGLPIYGVNMPAHFMLKYEKYNLELFIDPFNQGRVLDKQDCIRFLQNSGVPYVEQYLAKAPTIDIVERMLNNLRNSYTELGNTPKLHVIDRYLNIIREFRGDVALPPDEPLIDDDSEETDV